MARITLIYVGGIFLRRKLKVSKKCWHELVKITQKKSAVYRKNRIGSSTLVSSKYDITMI